MIYSENVLNLYNISNGGLKFQGNYGLYNGAMGMAITFFLAAQYTQNNSFREKGLDLLHSISDNISEIDDLSFDKGILGIGWAIEWLVQNNLLWNVNTYEVLIGIDDVMYQRVVFSKISDGSLGKGILGMINYFFRRDISINNQSERFAIIFNQECLVILIDQLHGIIEKYKTIQRFDEVINESQELINIANTLLIMSKIKHINKKVVKSILDTMFVFSENLLNFSICNFSNRVSSSKEWILRDLNLIYLFISYSISSVKVKRYPQLQRDSMCILKSSNVLNLNSENSYDTILKAKSIQSLLDIYLPQFSFSEKKNVFFEISSEKYFQQWTKEIEASILSEIGIQKPGLIEDWYEVFFNF